MVLQIFHQSPYLSLWWVVVAQEEPVQLVTVPVEEVAVVE
jgi:hypothetical protein